MAEETIVTSTDEVKPDVEVETKDVIYGSEDDSKTEDEGKEAKGQESKEGEESESDKVADSEKDDQKEETKDAQDSDKEAIEYELTLPKETFLSDDTVNDIREFAKENGLSNEAANQMLEREDSAIANYIIGAAEKEDAQVNAWHKEVTLDPEMGGENLKTTVANSKAVLDKFAPEGFVNILQETGYGNHPEVVKFLSRVGNAMSDDKLIMPGAHGETSKSTADLFYGKK